MGKAGIDSLANVGLNASWRPPKSRKMYRVKRKAVPQPGCLAKRASPLPSGRRLPPIVALPRHPRRPRPRRASTAGNLPKSRLGHHRHRTACTTPTVAKPLSARVRTTHACALVTHARARRVRACPARTPAHAHARAHMHVGITSHACRDQLVYPHMRARADTHMCSDSCGQYAQVHTRAPHAW